MAVQLHKLPATFQAANVFSGSIVYIGKPCFILLFETGVEHALYSDHLANPHGLSYPCKAEKQKKRGEFCGNSVSNFSSSEFGKIFLPWFLPKNGTISSDRPNNSPFNQLKPRRCNISRLTMKYRLRCHGPSEEARHAA
jgi:hypothetical protein